MFSNFISDPLSFLFSVTDSEKNTTKELMRKRKKVCCFPLDCAEFKGQ